MVAMVRPINLPYAPAPTRAVYVNDPREIERALRYAERRQYAEKASKQCRAISRRHKHMKWTAENERVLIDMYNAKVLFADIAKELGCSERQISQRVTILKHYGRLAPRRKVSDEKVRQIISLRKKGKSFPAIAEIVGVKSNTAMKIYNRFTQE